MHAVRSVIGVSPVHTGTQPVGTGDTQITDLTNTGTRPVGTGDTQITDLTTHPRRRLRWRARSGTWVNPLTHILFGLYIIMIQFDRLDAPKTEAAVTSEIWYLVSRRPTHLLFLLYFIMIQFDGLDAPKTEAAVASEIWYLVSRKASVATATEALRHPNRPERAAKRTSSVAVVAAVDAGGGGGSVAGSSFAPLAPVHKEGVNPSLSIYTYIHIHTHTHTHTHIYIYIYS